MRNTFLLSKAPSPWYFVTAATTDSYEGRYRDPWRAHSNCSIHSSMYGLLGKNSPRCFSTFMSALVLDNLFKSVCTEVLSPCGSGNRFIYLPGWWGLPSFPSHGDLLPFQGNKNIVFSRKRGSRLALWDWRSPKLWNGPPELMDMWQAKLVA